MRHAGCDARPQSQFVFATPEEHVEHRAQRLKKASGKKAKRSTARTASKPAVRAGDAPAPAGAGPSTQGASAESAGPFTKPRAQGRGRGRGRGMSPETARRLYLLKARTQQIGAANAFMKRGKARGAARLAKAAGST